MEINRASVLEELRRELDKRCGVYPSWIAQGKLSKKTADFRVAALEKAIDLIEKHVPDDDITAGQLPLFGGEEESIAFIKS